MAKKVTPRFKTTPQTRRPNQFRAWRKYRGLTLEQAADRAGMTAGNISAMERATQGYTQDGLEALAEAYNTEPGLLLNVDPTKDDAMWSIWDKAKEGQRRMIIDLAKTVLKTGTGS